MHNSYEYGFRVPLIAVSASAKPGYVSDVTDDFGRMLRSLSCFSLCHRQAIRMHGLIISTSVSIATRHPLTFHTILEPVDASHFLERTIVHPSILMVEQSDRAVSVQLKSCESG